MEEGGGVSGDTCDALDVIVGFAATEREAIVVAIVESAVISSAESDDKEEVTACTTSLLFLLLPALSRTFMTRRPLSSILLLMMNRQTRIKNNSAAPMSKRSIVSACSNELMSALEVLRKMDKVEYCSFVSRRVAEDCSAFRSAEIQEAEIVCT